MDDITIINGARLFLCEDIAEPEGFEAPTYRTVYLDPPNRPGSRFINELPGSRELSFRGLIKTNVAINRRLLSDVCFPDGNQKLLKFRSCDGIALQVQATVRLVMPFRSGRSPYMIQATAEYPYFESQELKKYSIGIATTEGGTPIPAAIPAPMPGGITNVLNVINLGGQPAALEFHIIGPGQTFIIKNLDSSEEFTLDIPLTAGEEVIINGKTNDAYKGNQSVFGKITRTPSTKWPRAYPGTNRFAFRAITGGTSQTRLDIYLRDTYAGQ